jgi:hypothetical protein
LKAGELLLAQIVKAAESALEATKLRRARVKALFGGKR